MGSWLLVARAETRNPILVVGEPPGIVRLGLSVLINPVMDFTNAGTSAGVNFTVYPDSAFVCALGFAAAFLNANHLRYQASTDIYNTHASTTAFPPTAQNISTQIIQWAGFGPGGLAFFWNGGTEDSPSSVVSWPDADGNVALWEPVVVVDAAGSGEMLVPTLVIELVSGDAYTATVRVTRSHPVGGLLPTSSPYGHVEWTWLGVGLSGVADPEDPTNTDKVLVTVGVGVWTVGARAGYVNDSLGETYNCYSVCTAVFEVG